MSNPTRGEIGFDAGGRHYRLVYSVNALCALEDKLGEGAFSIAQMMSDPARMRIATVRTLFWAGLRDHHADMTEEAAGELMGAITIPIALEHVGAAMAAAFPADASASRPLAAGRKAGKRS